jgi:hypothetical protein
MPKEEIYCLRCKCKKKIDAKNIRGVVKFKNGRFALSAICSDSTCGMKLYRIFSDKDKKMMEEKYGKCKK